VPVRKPSRFLSSLLIPLALLPGILAIVLVSSHTVPAAAPALPIPRLASTPAPALPKRAPTAGPVPTNRAWQSTNPRLLTDAFAVDPSHPTTSIAGTVQGLWKSDDSGATWKPLPGYPPTSAVLALAVGGNPRLLYAADNNGFVRVRTGQGVWQAIGPTPAPGSIFSLAVSDTARPVILAGTAGALYRGVEQGAKWQWRVVARTDGSSFAAITWLGGGATNALAGVFGSAPPVLATHDGGKTWKAASQGLPSTLPMVAMLQVRNQPATTVLSTMGTGVWERTGAGAWREMSSGLPERHAMPLAGSMGGNPLFAGTMGYGVYMRKGSDPWRLIGKGLTGPSYIVLALLHEQGRRPALLAGTGVGVYRYTLGP
jgi:photosystem II stability/assembly factor-like uncharacterized protein